MNRPHDTVIDIEQAKIALGWKQLLALFVFAGTVLSQIYLFYKALPDVSDLKISMAKAETKLSDIEKSNDDNTKQYQDVEKKLTDYNTRISEIEGFIKAKK